MIYYKMFDLPSFKGEELKKASNVIKQAFPNGPKVHTVFPGGPYTFNDIASNIRPQLTKLNKSLK